MINQLSAVSYVESDRGLIAVLSSNPDVERSITDRLSACGHPYMLIRTSRELCHELNRRKYSATLLNCLNVEDLSTSVGAIRSMGHHLPMLCIVPRESASQMLSAISQLKLDDFLCAPFDASEMEMRIQRLTGLKQAASERALVQNDFTLDPKSHRVWKSGQRVELVAQEFRILEFFMRHPNCVLSPDCLLENLWPSATSSGRTAVRMAVRRLRRKVDPEGKVIRTVNTVGYIFDSPDSLGSQPC